MEKSHPKRKHFQVVMILYLFLTVPTVGVGNFSETNYTNTSFVTEINNVYKSNSEENGEQRSLDRQKEINIGATTEWTYNDQTKHTRSSLKSSMSTESSLENQYHRNMENSLSTSNYLSSPETLAPSAHVPQSLEIIEDAASCSQKCGQIQTFPCSCDLKCLIHKNCCEDMAVVCPEILQESQIQYGHMLGMQVECSSKNIFLITECDPKDITNGEKVQGVQSGKSATDMLLLTRDYETDIKNVMDAINNAYVTDTTTGFVYKNWDVFSCAALKTSNPVRWSVTFKTGAVEDLYTLQNMLQRMVAWQAPVVSPPVGLEKNLTGAPCTQTAIGTCMDDWVQKDPDTVSRCQQFISYVSVGKQVYRNKYCAVCSGLSQETLISTQPVNNGIDIFEFSLTMSLSGNSLKVVVKQHTTVFDEKICPLNSQYHTDLENVGNSCPSQRCNIYSVRRPDGVCKGVYDMLFAVADDGFPLTADEHDSFPEFLYCFIKSYIPDLDIDDNFYPTVPLFDYRLNMTLYTTRGFLFHDLSIFSTEVSMSPQVYSNLSLFSQQFKAHRMLKANDSRSWHISENTSQLHQVMSDPLYSDGRPAYYGGAKKVEFVGVNTTMCHCTRVLQTSVSHFFNTCYLGCSQSADIDYKDLLSRTNLTNKCRSLSGGQSGTSGPVSVYMWMIYLFQIMAAVDGII